MPTTSKTITQVLDEFLADQKERIKPKTFSRYASIIDLFKSYLESYWPGHSGAEYSQITDSGGTFCNSFGPEEILGGYGEFLDYFMPRKVVCGKELMKAAGTVTGKLAAWLAEKGYAADTTHAQKKAAGAARDLPNTQRVLDLLDDFAAMADLDDGDREVMDHFSIKKIEPGKLWLAGFTEIQGVIGPVPVPPEVTQICQLGWDIGATVVKTPRGWRFVEVWNVSP